MGVMVRVDGAWRGSPSTGCCCSHRARKSRSFCTTSLASSPLSFSEWGSAPSPILWSRRGPTRKPSNAGNWRPNRLDLIEELVCLYFLEPLLVQLAAWRNVTSVRLISLNLGELPYIILQLCWSTGIWFMNWLIYVKFVGFNSFGSMQGPVEFELLALLHNLAVLNCFKHLLRGKSILHYDLKKKKINVPKRKGTRVGWSPQTTNSHKEIHVDFCEDIHMVLAY